MITSLQNPFIKNVLKLSKARERMEQQRFVIEGARELSLALEGGYEFVELYVCRELFATTRYPGVLTTIPEKVVVEVSREVFRKMVYRESSDGVVALAKPKEHKLGDLRLVTCTIASVLFAIFYRWL